MTGQQTSDIERTGSSSGPVSKSKSDLAERVKILIIRKSHEKFSLKEISGELFLNENYIIRTFREVTGFTPLEYHNRVRCEKACELLKKPDLKISFVSDTVGYSTQAHFTRMFKNIYGCTPTEFRKQHLNNNNNKEKKS